MTFELTPPCVRLFSLLNPEKNLVSAKVNHFTKYAAFAVKASTAPTDHPTTAQPLTDLSGHWAEASVQQLIQLKATESKIFADTDKHWAADAIGTVAALGIVTVDGTGNFRPNAPITREEMAVIMTRALKLEPSAASSAFKDESSISTWATDAVSTAVAKGLLSGFEDGTFRAQAQATRAEAATLIVRALQNRP